MAAVLAVEQKRQHVADHKSFGEGQGQVLVLAEAKTLPHPFVEGLVPRNGPSDGTGVFFFSQASRMAAVQTLGTMLVTRSALT